MLYHKGKTCRTLVPTAGLEPARPIKPRDFKSLVSTIPPRGHPDIGIVLLIFMLQSSQKYHFFIQSEFLISKVFFLYLINSGLF